MKRIEECNSAKELADVLGAKWDPQFEIEADPLLYDLRADLLLLVQRVTGPKPPRLICTSCGNQNPTIVYRDFTGGELRESCDQCKTVSAGGPMGGF